MIGILLAAGRGTRMKSDKPKVLFDVNDEPLCFAGLRALMEHCQSVVVVVGYRGEEVRQALLQRAHEQWGEENIRERIVFQTQEPPRGTGDAVKVALKSIEKNIQSDDEILVVNGDLPLIRAFTLKKFTQAAKAQHAVSACLTQRVRQPKGLGRILRDAMGVFLGIREEKDASVEEKKISEINGGVYYFQASFLLDKIKSLNANNAQNEFYLTDLLGIKTHSKASVAVLLRNPFDLLGVNNTLELASARKIAQFRLQRKLCEEFGVDFEDPSSAFVSSRAQFGNACRIGPSVVIRGRCRFGNEVTVDGNAYLKDSVFDDHAHILWGTVVESAKIGARTKVGPMAHLRPGTLLAEDVKIGNFVELKKTSMGAGSKASHLSYLGDAFVGAESNIGCGTITCNYDGFSKNVTKIGAKAFIGSDTQLVAPVEIGEGAYVGSGTTVTQDVPAGALALSRSDMVIKENYAKKLEERMLKLKKDPNSLK